eukprot:TRINITY_DN6665_c0_g1_i4.p1 TRINITY_DN6665_c0_g1~~TRINITY_DN6665_c0_g1_i4.p1  ORF type:complete len:589 (-),score=117.60 TRINITY_DN6665_c0_g1_i4:227-1993(-)
MDFSHGGAPYGFGPLSMGASHTTQPIETDVGGAPSHAAGSGPIGSSSVGSGPIGSVGLKTQFKTPEGRYRYMREFGHPTGKVNINAQRSTRLAFLYTAHTTHSSGVANSSTSSHPHLQSSNVTAVSTTASTPSTASIASTSPSNPSSTTATHAAALPTSTSSTSISANIGSVAVSNSADPSYDALRAKVLPPPLMPPHPLRMFVAYNIGDTLYFNDLNGNDQSPIENYRLRSAHPTCHDMIRAPYPAKSGQTGVHVLVGFSTGDVCVQDPLFKSINAHFNKEGGIVPSKVNAVKWVSQVSSVFATAHNDGSLVFWDSTRDSEHAISQASRENEKFYIINSKSTKSNPLSKWTFSTSAIKDFAFAPDSRYFAVACADGYLRVFDYEQDSMLATFRSYYGAFTCVNWSPDGRYIVTGGEDDLVSVFSFHDRALVARGEGHRSYVSKVAFDEFHCKDHSYRIGSVGQDGYLLLWDFAVESLYKTRSMSISKRDQSPPNSGSGADTSIPTRTNAHARTIVPSMEPFVSGRIASEPLTDLIFLEGCMVAACVSGQVKLFVRMNQPLVEEKHQHTSDIKESPASVQDSEVDAKS